MKPTPNRFSILLRTSRQAKNLTLRELGAATPFSYSHLSRMETGHRQPPPRDGVIRIATALGADVDAFLVAAGYVPASGDHGQVPPMGFSKHDAAKVKHPPSADELRLLEEAASEAIYFGPLNDAVFWDAPQEERRASFRYLEGLIEEARRHRLRRAEAEEALVTA